jgi:hypothetical protein
MAPKFPRPKRRQPIQAGRFTLQPLPLPIFIEDRESLAVDESQTTLSIEDEDFLNVLNTRW